MNSRPINPEIVAKWGRLVTRRPDAEFGLVFGYDAVTARDALHAIPGRIAEAILTGDLEYARAEAGKFALARDSVLTVAELRVAVTA